MALVLLALAGWGWLCGAVTTGQRLPGASFAWGVPALGGAVGAAVWVATAAALGRRWGQVPVRLAVRTVWPFAVSWFAIGTLLLSDRANHLFAYWPRARWLPAG